MISHVACLLLSFHTIQVFTQKNYFEDNHRSIFESEIGCDKDIHHLSHSELLKLSLGENVFCSCEVCAVVFYNTVFVEGDHEDDPESSSFYSAIRTLRAAEIMMKSNDPTVRVLSHLVLSEGIHRTSADTVPFGFDHLYITSATMKNNTQLVLSESSWKLEESMQVRAQFKQ